MGSSFSVVGFPRSKETANFGIGPTGEIVGAYVSPDGVEHGFFSNPEPLNLGQTEVTDLNPGTSAALRLVCSPAGRIEISLTLVESTQSRFLFARFPFVSRRLKISQKELSDSLEELDASFVVPDRMSSTWENHEVSRITAGIDQLVDHLRCIREVHVVVAGTVNHHEFAAEASGLMDGR